MLGVFIKFEGVWTNKIKYAYIYLLGGDTNKQTLLKQVQIQRKWSEIYLIIEDLQQQRDKLPTALSNPIELQMKLHINYYNLWVRVELWETHSQVWTLKFM